MSKSATIFNNAFINSSRFLMLSTSTKLLYFYLLKDADDDGIVDGYATIRILNVELTDWTALIERRFIILLEKPFLAWITDYTLHNQNRDLRFKKDSPYLPLLAEKVPDAEIQVRIRNEHGKFEKTLMTVTYYLKNSKKKTLPIPESSNACETHVKNGDTHENYCESHAKDKTREDKTSKEKTTTTYNMLLKIGLAADVVNKLLKSEYVAALSAEGLKAIYKYAQQHAVSNVNGYFLALLRNKNFTLPQAQEKHYDPNCPKCHGSGKYMQKIGDDGYSEEVEMHCDCYKKYTPTATSCPSSP